MDESMTWKDIVYHLFTEGELNESRCLSIMHNNNVDNSGILSAVIEGAVNRGDTENIELLSTNLTSFLHRLETYEREVVTKEDRQGQTIRKFRAQLTMTIPREGRKLHDTRSEHIRDLVKEEYRPYYDDMIKLRAKHGRWVQINSFSHQKCRLCNNEYHSFKDMPGLLVCIDCVNEYVACFLEDSKKERLKYEADMRDLMEFMTNDKFGRKRKRSKNDK